MIRRLKPNGVTRQSELKVIHTENNIKRFTCLYTKHKTQKSKTWQDGIFSFNSSNRKDEWSSTLNSYNLQSIQRQIGSDLELELHLVTIEGENDVGSVPKSVVSPATPVSAPSVPRLAKFRPPSKRQPSLEDRHRNQDEHLRSIRLDTASDTPEDKPQVQTVLGVKQYSDASEFANFKRKVIKAPEPELTASITPQKPTLEDSDLFESEESSKRMIPKRRKVEEDSPEQADRDRFFERPTMEQELEEAGLDTLFSSTVKIPKTNVTIDRRVVSTASDFQKSPAKKYPEIKLPPGPKMSMGLMNKEDDEDTLPFERLTRNKSQNGAKPQVQSPGILDGYFEEDDHEDDVPIRISQVKGRNITLEEDDVPLLSTWKKLHNPTKRILVDRGGQKHSHTKKEGDDAPIRIPIESKGSSLFGRAKNGVVTKPFKPPIVSQAYSPDSASLTFPGYTDATTIRNKNNGRLPHHKVKIPTSFVDTVQYRTIWMTGLIEDINLQLLKLAVDLYGVFPQISQIMGGATAISCPHGKAVLRTVNKPTPNKGRQFYCCPGKENNKCKLFKWVDELKADGIIQEDPLIVPDVKITPGNANTLRSSGVKIYLDCEIVRSKNESQQSIRSCFKRMQEGAPMNARSGAVYLKLSEGFKEKSTESVPSHQSRLNQSSYAKDDLWIVSTTPTFTVKSSSDQIYLVRSAFHGPARSGLLEGLYVIHGPNLSTEFSMLDNLSSVQPDSDKLPILEHLLGAPGGVPRGRIRSVRSDPLSLKMTRNDLQVNLVHTHSKLKYQVLADETSDKYSLNRDQERVLNSLLVWFHCSDDSSPSGDPILLVHGVFGSGKSYLLVVLIVFICRIAEMEENREIRILVCSSTNTAVDRVLLGLLDQQFTDFIRVGSIKKIAKPILDYTLQSGEEKEALRDLNSMLNEPGISVKEWKDIKKNIDEIKGGQMSDRLERLKEVPVVGVTCAASPFPVLTDHVFPIIFLDECSQMLEPLSLIPMNRFGCHRMLGVGDPLQLPPTLSIFTDDATMREGIGRTLFVRLASLDHPPILLRRQYRCHPKFSRIANVMFYEGRLEDGVSEEDRKPLEESIPSLLFCNDDRGEETRDRFGSYHNDYEVKLVCHLIRLLLKKGVRGNQIGVIALSQMYHLIQAITNMEIPHDILEANSRYDREEEEEMIHVDASKKGKTIKAPKSSSLLRSIQVSTVDAFQGAEKEVILLACSRTVALGFSDSPNRLNVALTRAKRHLFIVGKSKVLSSDAVWRTVITEASSMEGGIVNGSTLLSGGEFPEKSERAVYLPPLPPDPTPSVGTPRPPRSKRKKGVEGEGGALDPLEGFTEADEEAIALLERQQQEEEREEGTKGGEEAVSVQRPRLKMKPITLQDEDDDLFLQESYQPTALTPSPNKRKKNRIESSSEDEIETEVNRDAEEDGTEKGGGEEEIQVEQIREEIREERESESEEETREERREERRGMDEMEEDEDAMMAALFAPPPETRGQSDSE
ncbi:hypothetical protein PROFUN_14265 [Planoprotostelium fungivorum]|uniref:GRF-type domain-containing protein n=1 Tax=Planoprotostelium fungivorum TaxID=1890364 RepID=A0A2P6N0M1_9EUKA|nr:hypothetical protein PROFUN_14261 [Planoprotostelium fungivorum]PRP77516.1 hypothetical protein PROFUN_14265 [Planoprotostelium fungivorum]